MFRRAAFTLFFSSKLRSGRHFVQGSFPLRMNCSSREGPVPYSDYNEKFKRSSHDEVNLSARVENDTGLYLDEDTAESLNVENRFKYSRSEVNKQRQLENECLRKVMDIADGKAEFETLSLRVLNDALQCAVRIRKRAFVVQYFDTWWRLFEDAVNHLNSELEGMTKSDDNTNTQTEICGLFEEIFRKIVSLNSHGHGLIRIALSYKDLQYMQLVASKLVTFSSPRLICKIAETLDNLYTLDDVNHPWCIVNSIFVSSLIKRFKQILSADSSSLQEFDWYYCIARVSWILAKQNARITSEQKQLLIECCQKVIDINKSATQFPADLSDDPNEVARLNFICNNACKAHYSAGCLLERWQSAEQQDEKWSDWFAGANKLMTLQQALQTKTQSLLGAASKVGDLRMHDVFLMCNSLGRVCSSCLFLALQLNKMDSFDQLKKPWQESLERVFHTASFATCRRMFDEIVGAEYIILKNVAITTANSKLISDDFRTSLQEKAAFARERRLIPYAEMDTNESEIKDRLSGNLQRQNRRPDSFSKFDNNDRKNSRQFYKPMRDNDWRDNDAGQHSGRISRSENRFGRPNFEEGADGQEPVFRSRIKTNTSGDHNFDERRGRYGQFSNARTNHSLSENTGDEELDSLFSLSPSNRRRSRTSQQEKRNELTSRNFLDNDNFEPTKAMKKNTVVLSERDDFEDPDKAENELFDANRADDFGSLSIRTRTRRVSRSNTTFERQTDNESEFL